MSRTEAEKRYGVRIYQGGAVPAAVLRIVDIEGWDVEACGGTHLTETILVGPIKILGSKKIHDGVVRIEFVAGEKALKVIQEREQYLRDACKILHVQPENLPNVVDRFFTEWKRQKDELLKLWRLLGNNVMKFIGKENMIDRDGKLYILARIDIDMGSLFSAIKILRKRAENILLGSVSLGENVFVASGNKDFMDLVAEIASKLGGNYKKTRVNIFGKLNVGIDNLLVKVKKALTKD